MNILSPSSYNVMVDLETLGTAPGSVVTSIGAVLFDKDRILETISINISLESSLGYGLKVQAKTLEWWMTQLPAVRAEQFKSSVSLGEALERFTRFISFSEVKVWGNGASFDNVLLRGLYDAAKQDAPWNYWNDRCYRTIKNSFPEISFQETLPKHVALNDAIMQTNHLLEIDKCLKN